MKKELILKNSIKYGIIIFVALVGYFFLMKFFDLIRHQELRAFNGVIIFIAVIMAISKQKRLSDGKIGYFNGIGCGLLTSLFGVGPFSLFILAYLMIDTSFLLEIQQRSAYGDLINPFTGAFVNFIEGMAAGMISAFIVMPYFKTSTLKQMNAPRVNRKKVVA